MTESHHFKVTLFFPLYDNERNLFEEEIWYWWRNEITDLISGFTDLGIVNGWWQGYSDENRWIMMIVAEEMINSIRTFLRRARMKFKQEAMYLDYHPVTFEEVV